MREAGSSATENYISSALWLKRGLRFAPQGYCPFWDLPAFKMTEYKYCGMHTLSNYSNGQLDLLVGGGTLLLKDLPAIIEFEHAQGRFLGWHAGDRYSAPWVASAQMQDLMRSRLHTLDDQGLLSLGMLSAAIMHMAFDWGSNAGSDNAYMIPTSLLTCVGS